MSSLKKNFSIAKLYSDLQKYEENVTGFKDSRLRKQLSGASMHQRPSSSHYKNYQTKQAYAVKNFGLTTNVGRFQKNRQSVDPGISQSKIKGKYSAEEKYRKQQNNQRSFFNEDLKKKYENNENNWTKKQFQGDKLKKNHKKNNLQFQKLKLIENKRSYTPSNNNISRCYNKNDQLYFLSQCSKLYNMEQKQNIKDLSAQQQVCSVKKLINQINKRDKIYQIVTNKLGVQNVQQKLNQFFNSYSRLEKIICQFKKMSKLQIDDQKQLYQFLFNEQESQQGTKQRQKVEKRQCIAENQKQLNDIQK